jgi:hypothetical protein
MTASANAHRSDAVFDDERHEIDGSKLAAVVEMLVLHAEKVPLHAAVHFERADEQQQDFLVEGEAQGVRGNGENPTNPQQQIEDDRHVVHPRRLAKHQLPA